MRRMKVAVHLLKHCKMELAVNSVNYIQTAILVALFLFGAWSTVSKYQEANTYLKVGIYHID